jgi:hypothetical protein
LTPVCRVDATPLILTYHKTPYKIDNCYNHDVISNAHAFFI